ncbi:abcF4 [Symbiodinium pilosum]|uniref:AbcF4 protein n=1 Tax=Symbiodinium pilosum TaxID=2952 RepID=A0A812NV40_SYMPI|nr:abcF4 [Symbiodinium pilosum]
MHRDMQMDVEVFTETKEAPGNAVKASKLHLTIGALALLKNAELTIGEGPEKRSLIHGLVGPNGCGKTTLLREIARGDRIKVPKSWSVHYVDQHLPEPTDATPIEEVLKANGQRTKLLEERQRLSQKLDAADPGEGQEAAATELKKVEDALGETDDDEAEILKTLVGLGFCDGGAEPVEGQAPSFRQTMHQLSGGWRMKVNLAKCLWLKPRLLLLDEPTNHLDFHALGWLSSYLQKLPNTITVIVSHNCEFLRDTCDIFLCIQDQKILRKEHHKISDHEISQMQKMPKTLDFKFQAANGQPHEHALSFHDVTFSYKAAEPFLRDLNGLKLSGTSRCGILGRNGCGKSALMDLCIGKATPKQGEIHRSAKMEHFSQHFIDEINELIDSNPTITAASFLVEKCGSVLGAQGGASEEKQLRRARAVLKNFGLQDERDMADNVPLKSLSGGQKARLNLAYLSLRPCHILFLDEPTNHLDAAAVDALTQAAVNFPGGVVAVSHDARFLRRLMNESKNKACEFLAVESGTVKSMAADKLSDYIRQAKIEQFELAEKAKMKAFERKRRLSQSQRACGPRAETKPPEADVKPNLLKEHFKKYGKPPKPVGKSSVATPSKARPIIPAVSALEVSSTRSQELHGKWPGPGPGPAGRHQVPLAGLDSADREGPVETLAERHQLPEQKRRDAAELPNALLAGSPELENERACGLGSASDHVTAHVQEIRGDDLQIESVDGKERDSRFKQIRKLRKALREIQRLESEQSWGVALRNNQRQKLGKKEAYQSELESLCNESR